MNIDCIFILRGKVRIVFQNNLFIVKTFGEQLKMLLFFVNFNDAECYDFIMYTKGAEAL